MDQFDSLLNKSKEDENEVENKPLDDTNLDMINLNIKEMR